MAHSNRTLSQKFRGPGHFGVLEAAVQNEEFPALLQSVAGLNKRTRGVACLDNHRGLCESGYSCVPLREGQPVAAERLTGVANDGNLADDQEFIRDLALQDLILGWVAGRNRRAEDCYRQAAGSDRCCVSSRVNSLGQTRPSAPSLPCKSTSHSASLTASRTDHLPLYSRMGYQPGLKKFAITVTVVDRLLKQIDMHASESSNR
jgi:hypothetical protein